VPIDSCAEILREEAMRNLTCRSPPKNCISLELLLVLGPRKPGLEIHDRSLAVFGIQKVKHTDER
jgi:hypothetical protein